MEIIKQLIKDKFLLFNVSVEKIPLNKNSKPLDDWNNKSYDELLKEHNYNSTRWGLLLGLQANGKRIMSLDFDVYNKNSPDGNCEITLGKLNEYLEGCLNEDGLYISSTEGNMNVLIDYTYRQDIIDMVEKLGSNKFKHSNLEILLGGNQVIPPSQTICKRNKKLGKPRTFQNNQVIYEITSDDDFTANFIINLFNIKFQENQTTKMNGTNPKVIQNDINDTTDSDTTDSDTNKKKEDKFLELLFKIIKNETKKNKNLIDWDDWFQIGGILKYNNYSYKIFQDYSKLGNDYNEQTTNELWNNIKNVDKTMSIYGLQNIAKKINPYGYREWLDKHNEILHLGILNKGENDVAIFISKFLESNLVYCVNDWIQFNEKNNLWRIIQEPTADIITTIQSKISEAQSFTLQKLSMANDEEERTKLKKEKKEYDDMYKNVCKSSYSSQVVKFLKTYLRNDDFTSELDDSLYKLYFKNGYLDLKTNNFVKGIKRNDFITKTILFDWEEPTEENIKDVKKTLKKICNWNEAHLEYYLSMLGYSFTGDSSKEQNFWYLRGQTASNGKSVIFEALEKIMPNYIMKSGSDVLDKGADMRKEVATWKGLKLLWLNEVSTKIKNAELVKSICDGTSYKYNRLYSTEAIIMPITFKLIAVSNNSLVISGDEGIKRRFKLLQHNAQFKDEYNEDNYELLEFKKDKGLSAKLTDDLKFALISLIATYSKAYWIEKQLKKYPVEWNEEANENMAENDIFNEWFNDTFELDISYFIHKEDFNSVFQNSEVKHLKPKDEIARMKYGCRYESQMLKTISIPNDTKTIKKKGYWIGFKLKEN